MWVWSLTRMSWAAIRSRSPCTRTLPSTTKATPSSAPIYLFAVTLALAIPSNAADRVSSRATPAKLDGQALFERLKLLVGEWRGEWSPGGLDTTVTYSLTGNGSVLVEDYALGETTMSTLYHLDGDDLMLTHYCSIGNQPRMRAITLSADGREVVFDEFDITNLGDTGYSERLTLTLTDEDHIAVFFRGSRTGDSSGVKHERVR